MATCDCISNIMADITGSGSLGGGGGIIGGGGGTAAPPYDVVSTTPSAVSTATAVTYTCDVYKLWSAARHPIMYPEGAVFSPPVMVGHSFAYTMFRAGTMASQGVEDVAETGDTTAILAELAVASSATGTPVVGAGQPGDVQTLPDPLEVDGSMPYVSAITMLAPSPDWFTGFNGFKAAGDDDMWYSSFTLDTYPWDSGTEAGNTFTTMGDIAENINVFRITENTEPATVNGAFLDPTGETVLPVGRFECTMN